MRIQNGVKEAVFTPQTIGNKTTDSQEKVNTDAIKTVGHKTPHLQGETVQEEKVLLGDHEVIQAIEKANKHIKSYDRRLEFSIHEITKQIMVKVINTEDDTVIREIPSEKILDMVAHLWEVVGILVDEKR